MCYGYMMFECMCLKFEVSEAINNIQLENNLNTAKARENLPVSRNFNNL